MLKQCVDIFTDTYDEKELIDNCLLKEGYYALITRDKSNKLIFNENNTFEVNKKVDTSAPLYRQVATYNYYSTMFSNKPITSMKDSILSCNYYSFFTTANAVDTDKITEDLLNSYYSILENPKLKYKDIQLDLYDYVENNMLSKVNIDEVQEIKQFMLENYKKILATLEHRFNYKRKPPNSTGSAKSSKIFKILIEASVDDYKREFNRYYYLNCFTTMSSIIQKEDNFWGAPAIDFTMNEKKPFLKNFTRKQRIPILTEYKDTLNTMQFNKYLQGFYSLGYRHYYFNVETNEMNKFKDDEFDNKFFNRRFNGIYLKYEKTGDKTKNISCLENIMFKPDKLKKLSLTNKIFEINDNYMNLYKDYYEKNSILNLISLTFFNGLLVDYKKIDSDSFDIKGFMPYELREIMGKYKESLLKWAFTQDDNLIRSIYYNMFKDVLKYNLTDDYNVRIKLPSIINLYFALDKYLGGNDMLKNNLGHLNSLDAKLELKTDFTFENNEEFCFAVGHLARYLINQNESQQNKNNLFTPILSERNVYKYKEHIKRLYKKYAYKLSGSYLEILMSAVIGYVPVSNEIDESALLSGYLSKNLLFKSRKNKKENINNEENVGGNYND